MVCKKKLVCLVMVLAFTLNFAGVAYAGSVEDLYEIREQYQELIDQEKGTLFEKSIANLIGSIAYGLTYIGNSLLGFKNLDALIFNKGIDEESLPPFTDSYWQKLDTWFTSMAYIAISFMLYAVVMVAFKFIRAGTNPKLRENAIDSLKRTVFSWLIVAAAPIFVRLLFRTNNFLVDAISSISSGSVADQLGANGALLKQVRTGNVIATSFIILLFSYINFRLNIMFLIRQFVMTVFYIFTPFVAVMWVINKDVNAAGIWLGEMLSNAFMQFSYAFVFTIFLSFSGENIHWATSIVWAMMCLSVAEVIRNSTQSLWTRLSGIGEGAEASKIMGLLGAGGLPSFANAIGGQFTSALGPGGAELAKHMGRIGGSGGGFSIGGAIGTMAQSTAGAGGGASQIMGRGRASYSYNRGHARVSGGYPHVGTGPSPASRGPAQADIHYQQPLGRRMANQPQGGSIEKVAALASALDQSAGAGYYVERGLSMGSGIARAAAGEGGAGFVRGIARMAGTGVRAVGGAVGIAKATRKYMKEEGKTFKQALKDLTGAQTTSKAILRAGNLYMSHVATSQRRVQDKLLSYHTSIDGMRYK